MTLVETRDLRVELTGQGTPVVDGISFDVARGEVLAMAGESGSGKTTIGLALLGHARRGLRIARGQVRIESVDVTKLARAELLRLRQRQVAYVPQDPAAALNPALRIRTQIAQVVGGCEPTPRAGERLRRTMQVLRDVELPPDEEFLARFPHQLSGGQQQRVCLAAALVRDPSVIVLDEPTTGLDATTQARVLAMIRALCSKYELAVIYITHDLGAVSWVADRTLVLYAGRIAEIGPTGRVLGSPSHPYTRRLLKAIPSPRHAVDLAATPGRTPALRSLVGGCLFAPHCDFRIEHCVSVLPQLEHVDPTHEAACLRAPYVGRASSPRPPRALTDTNDRATARVLSLSGVSACYGAVRVLSNVSLEIGSGECVTLLGQSGAGKTTLARCVIGLHRSWDGVIELDGRPLAASVRDRPAELRRSMQYIFQNPYGSLNPRRTVAESVGLPLRQFFGLRGADLGRRMERLLENVSLMPALASRYPAELSGGERQLVALARALACQPRVLICDEVTSALDPLAQATVVSVIKRLQVEWHLSVLFITHDVALARALAHRVVVVLRGCVVEAGWAAEVFGRPRHTHTRDLIAATPDLDSPEPGPHSACHETTWTTKEV